MKFCLIAKSGDCAAGGLGKTNDVIPFKKKHNDLVKEFIQAQADLQIAHDFYEHGEPTTRVKIDRFYSAFGALKGLGVFDHKWHARTAWFVEAYSKGCLEWFNEDYGPCALAAHV